MEQLRVTEGRQATRQGCHRSLAWCFSIYGPEAVWGTEWDSLTVRCDYDQGWETYSKWWCRGNKILVTITGSEQTAGRNRESIRDDRKHHVFTITMKMLQRSDTDTYWCGIERTGTDLGVQVAMTVYPATPRKSSEPTTTDAAAPGTADTASPGTEDTAGSGTMDTALPRKAETAVPGKRNTAVPGTADTASPGTADTAEPLRTTTPTVLASWPSLTQSTNSTQPTALTSPLTR
ncbi:PREDICTED: CMRF35-like molecule 4 [Rhinopithecus bieti]|uniref:CMRF35-like molecule 4 n=1 Tax=Rhinopithecus bieti TaxID=61621 RepID=UPI00083C8EF6|nr:PREDICTED: CMRF35-like molecule 4 [Rhinopithecus bieti]